MSLHCPDLNTLRRRGTMKWATTDPDVIPMWIAESDFTTCPQVVQAVQDTVQRENFGYPAPPHDLREAFADFAADRYQWQVDPADVFALPDVVSAVIVAIEHFTAPQSDIILPVPAYHPFFEALKVTGRQGRFIPMLADDDSWVFDLDAIDAAFADGAGAMIVCNPYNPLGATFSADHLAQLANIAHRHGARLISDEIHAPLVYQGRHIPTASVSDVAADVTITTTATSKGWNTAGLKCAQMILSNASDRRTFATINPLITAGASTAGIAASTAAYRDGRGWLDEEVAYLNDNRHLAFTRLSDLPGVTPLMPAATYLMWTDFSGCKGELSHSPAQWIQQHARVRLSPGVDFGNNSISYARLNFATSREILVTALDRITSSLAELS